MVKVSVIIPVYNKEKYIERTIRSVLNQSFEDYELLFIDDGSLDNSAKIIQRYVDQRKDVYYYYHNNKGVSYSRNKGIELAKGEYITFLDADDEWEKDFLLESVNSIKDTNVCYSGHYLVQKGNRKENKISFTSGDILESFLKNKTVIHTDSWLIKRSFIKHNGIKFSEEIDIGEDWEFFSKVLIHEKNIKTTKKYLTIYYKDVTGSLTDINDDKLVKDVFWMENLISYVKLNESNETRSKMVETIFRTYRMPATIIYWIQSQIGTLSAKRLKAIYQSHYDIINNISLTNGLRSIKLILSHQKLIRSLHLKKVRQ